MGSVESRRRKRVAPLLRLGRRHAQGPQEPRQADGFVVAFAVPFGLQAFEAVIALAFGRIGGVGAFIF